MPLYPGTSAEKSPAAAKKAAAAHGTVLVVDDESLMRWTIRERLSERGLTVLEAESGAEALAILRTRHVDLALLDFELPDMDGLAILKRLRAEAIPCAAILMTAYGSPETTEGALLAGARRCVGKPFDLEEMVALVEAELHA
jgi:CheY-like chemotaxis protein